MQKAIVPALIFMLLIIGLISVSCGDDKISGKSDDPAGQSGGRIIVPDTDWESADNPDEKSNEEESEAGKDDESDDEEPANEEEATDENPLRPEPPVGDIDIALLINGEFHPLHVA